MPDHALAALLADPRQALTVDPATARELLVGLAAVQRALELAAAGPGPEHRNGGDPELGANGPLLTVQEAAALLSLTTKQLYRRVDRLPGVVRLGSRTLRFDRVKLAALVRSQSQGRAPRRGSAVSSNGG